MAYLQNGQCFSDFSAARSDFLSRINDFNLRIESARFLEKEVKGFFPECTPPKVFFDAYLMALFSFVCLCLSIKYIIKTAR